MSSSAKILLIEKDESLAEILKRTFRSIGHRVRTVSELDAGCELILNNQWDICFSDVDALECAGVEGKSILELACREDIQLPVVAIAGYDEFEAGDRAVAAGAVQWLSKPLRSEAVLQALEKILADRPARRVLEKPSAFTEEEPVDKGEEKGCHYGQIVGESPAMQDLYRQIEKAGVTDMTVLLQGESGTGKELAARALHTLSPRASRPFVAVNCAALPETLLESELFGYVKGAFTGAFRSKDGLFKAAEGGTIFLDEIGSISVNMQLSLLRVLQEREVRPVGAVTTQKVDVRVIAATNEDLHQRLKDGRMREDLYYRLSVFPIYMPPLRSREGDVELLAQHFLAMLDRESASEEHRLTLQALAALQAYEWPGNVRELYNVMNRARALSEGQMIGLSELPPEIAALGRAEEVPPEAGSKISCGEAEAFRGFQMPSGLSLKAYLRDCERKYIRHILEVNGGNKEAAAKILGISSATIYRKLDDLN